METPCKILLTGDHMCCDCVIQAVQQLLAALAIHCTEMLGARFAISRLEVACLQVEAGSDEEHQGLDRPSEEGRGGR